jgi:hypothetical protein
MLEPNLSKDNFQVSQLKRCRFPKTASMLLSAVQFCISLKMWSTFTRYSNKCDEFQKAGVYSLQDLIQTSALKIKLNLLKLQGFTAGMKTERFLVYEELLNVTNSRTGATQL